jgi:hypothetical protein
MTRVRVARLLAGLVIAGAAIVAAGGGADGAVSVPPTAHLAGTAGTPYTIEVLPQLELVSGVLSLTPAWVEGMDYPSPPSPYLQALQTRLFPYRDHEAFAIAGQLDRRGFTEDSYATFAHHLGPLPKLELRYEYNEHIKRWAKDREILERFRLALKDLAAVSDFEAFAREWAPEYAEWVAQVRRTFDGEEVIRWLEEFFGPGATAPAAYRVALAPSWYPAGGFGGTLSGPDGRPIVLETIREAGQGASEPTFTWENGYGLDLQWLAAHEWGHHFSDKALDQSQDLYAKLDPLYHQSAIRTQAGIPSLSVFVHEQVLRAVVCLATEEWHGPEAVEREMPLHERQGFLWTRQTVAILRDYQANRATYRDFASFAPTLLERMALLGPPQPNWVWPAAAGFAALAILALTWGLRRRARRRRPPIAS